MGTIGTRRAEGKTKKKSKESEPPSKTNTKTKTKKSIINKTEGHNKTRKEKDKT